MVGWGACLLGGGWLWDLKLVLPLWPPVPLWQGVTGCPWVRPAWTGKQSALTAWRGAEAFPANGWELTQVPLEGLGKAGGAGRG